MGEQLTPKPAGEHVATLGEQQRAHVREVIKTTLLATQYTHLQPSKSKSEELRTLQRMGQLPMWVTISEFCELWRDVERELEDEVHASRATRRESTSA